jgi:hypothetical protein
LFKVFLFLFANSELRFTFVTGDLLFVCLAHGEKLGLFLAVFLGILLLQLGNLGFGLEEFGG